MNNTGSTDAELIAAWDRGRRAGLEEALEACKRQGESALTLRMKLEEALEAAK